ncbi:hypothetical protein [Bradyrhizobium sp. Leo170]|uniref:hypothetical protein n=1 Tax=Bradyrhizobium sp. Leo170 TaxID=1571199 RepID=UPI00102E53AC|nr:hypothetical protein [Bradyrhizobium sp. Leo170]TAI67654.1 hypothetical protein CWO89_01245 [Bradyrhizobium sp. Leo170]
MTKEAKIILDLRAKLNDVEHKQVELIAERDELAFAALVDRDKKAADRVAAINSELSGLTNQIGAISAALKEAAKREAAAAVAERAKRRRDDARKAETIVAEVEGLGCEMDKALTAAKDAAVLIENKLAELRRLSGGGPMTESVRVNLCRAVVSANMFSPLHTVVLAPDERTTVQMLTTPWGRSIRNWIAGVLGTEKEREAA